MHRDLVIFVNFFHFIGVDLVVRDRPLVPNDIFCQAEKRGIEVKGRLKTVFVEQFDKSKILRHAVVKTERHRLVFSVPHTV